MLTLVLPIGLTNVNIDVTRKCENIHLKHAQVKDIDSSNGQGDQFPLGSRRLFPKPQLRSERSYDHRTIKIEKAHGRTLIFHARRYIAAHSFTLNPHY